METPLLFKKAQTILAKTTDFRLFEEEFAENLRFSGERMADGATFVFELEEDYLLIVSFSDYNFDDFAIVHKSFNGNLMNYL